MPAKRIKAKKCDFQRRAKTWQEREVGCPLDHCPCGTHDVNCRDHKCEVNDRDEEIAAAERAAGWDASP